MQASTGLLAAFQQSFREDLKMWLKRFDYKEAGPQLLMQASCNGSSTAAAASNVSMAWGM